MPWFRVTLHAHGHESSAWIYEDTATPASPKDMDAYLQDVWERWCQRTHDWTEHASHSFGGECVIEDPPREYLMMLVKWEQRRIRERTKSARSRIQLYKATALRTTAQNVFSMFRCWKGPLGGCGHSFEAIVQYDKSGHPRKRVCPNCKKVASQHGILSRVLPSTPLPKQRQGSTA